MSQSHNAFGYLFDLKKTNACNALLTQPLFGIDKLIRLTQISNDFILINNNRLLVMIQSI